MTDRYFPDHLPEGSSDPNNRGVTKWELLDSAKIYALPELLFSLYKFIPFYQPTSGSKQDRKRK